MGVYMGVYMGGSAFVFWVCMHGYVHGCDGLSVFMGVDGCVHGSVCARLSVCMGVCKVLI